MKLFLNPFLQKGESRRSISDELNSTAVEYWTGNITKERLTAKTLPKTLMKINLVALMVTMGLSQVGAKTIAQEVTIKRNKSNLETIFKDLEKQTGYTFFYRKSDIQSSKNISVDFKNIPLKEALSQILNQGNFSHEYFNNTIVIKKNANTLSSVKINTPSGINLLNQQQTIKGRVIDNLGNPIKGASIRLKSEPSKIVISDENGNFILPLTSLNEILVVSYVGFENKEVKSTLNANQMIVRLAKQETEIGEVVVTGTGINRNKDSFTGTTASFSGEELKAVSNNNIIQSLRTLDPSFLQIENNLAGSNPNIMPVIEVRGKSSIPSATLKDEFGSDPNQPLFVLDGFPTNIQTIMDLDINRVASVTILKDAASTALYGSQASNGVVVVETVKPKPGELRFSYTQDFRFESPDLSAYNMMNAKEKLEFEKLAGRYIPSSDGDPALQVVLENLYNTHLENVQRGVDTYWLNEPVKHGYSTNNSINVSGGDQAFTYNVGFNYRIADGVMKGSGRDSYGGTTNLTYRKDKLHVNNITYIRGTKTEESPYGSFADFVNANPYYEKNYDSPYLEVTRKADRGGTQLVVFNPLYNAVQNQYNKSSNIEVQNNFNANYDVTNYLRLNSGLQVTKGNSFAKRYRSPEMTDFSDTPLLRKGRYNDSRSNNFSYQVNLMLTFYKTFANDHIVNVNWRNTISENKNDSYQTIAEGFPAGSLGSPRFAYNYLQDGSPNSSSGVYRAVNSTLSSNYSFKNKYLFDFVYRIDGSTAYGSNRRYSPYYAFGLGWNIHREDFIKNQSWINTLRITGNVGITGNQNFSNISSISVYNYNSNVNYNLFGQGVSLSMLGNPNLEPQKTKQISTSIDFSLFNNRLAGYINAYNKETNPLIVPVDLPSSTGIFSYPYNIGSLTYQGVETKLTYFPIYNLEKGFTWNFSITGASYKSKYDGFGNILETLNKKQEVDKNLIRYIDGNSAEAIWATQSLGIDPTTGREVFLTKDGQYSFDYSAANIMNVGNTAAKMEGVISTNLRYKGFNFGIGLRYRIGGEIFNSALFNKVENITYTNIANNQDKRALYDRWKNPGDISQFKGISQTSSTPISSRFVQMNNSLSSETLNIGYLFNDQLWLKKSGIESLNINFLANDFLYFSTIRRERGIDYPYARTFALSLRASF
ncbi:SusC/RagA family TonB-linked outer membrane protein [Sphingobacterium bovistauri]|uniref:SusC/RagA family TonB-linked outer membrane protein n=1 Tax=Sphingobacterium bovistauri TaxID=2781959 RepID=A0ABS7Z892_9SPHI|nr:SusC/RagA family TonB-linked outer membrane protein [Sphingobacterium bovistauri]MCA5005636.1 SusC/RagA family TonB-linked outer membrane protein [Sphingobacterium bovistauri]